MCPNVESNLNDILQRDQKKVSRFPFFTLAVLVHFVKVKESAETFQRCTWSTQKVNKMCPKRAQDVHSIAIKGEHEQHTHCLHIPALVRASNTVVPPPL